MRPRIGKMVPSSSGHWEITTALATPPLSLLYLETDTWDGFRGPRVGSISGLSFRLIRQRWESARPAWGLQWGPRAWKHFPPPSCQNMGISSPLWALASRDQLENGRVYSVGLSEPDIPTLGLLPHFASVTWSLFMLNGFSHFGRIFKSLEYNREMVPDSLLPLIQPTLGRLWGRAVTLGSVKGQSLIYIPGTSFAKVFLCFATSCPGNKNQAPPKEIRKQQS